MSENYLIEQALDSMFREPIYGIDENGRYRGLGVVGLQRFSPEAEMRAEYLFLNQLDPEQMVEWRYERFISVRGSRGGIYCIYPIKMRNVLRIDTGYWYCLTADLPVFDLMLGIKFMIECDEDLFLNKAY